MSARSVSPPSRLPRYALPRVLFITGTDTGVGKTVVTALLARHLRDAGVRVAALKPICSGRRDDARVLRAALGGALSLDEVNPWYFPAPLAPVLAARREGRRVRLAQVTTQVRRFQTRSDVLLVEGAGGLLSPLGEGFSSRELLVALRATPVIVCPNRLGAVSQARLVLTALPAAFRRRAVVMLTGSRHASLASRANRALLSEHHPAACVVELPWISGTRATPIGVQRRFRRMLARLVRA